MLAVNFKRSSLNASLYIGFAAHIGSRNLKPLAFVLQEISNPSLLCLFFDHVESFCGSSISFTDADLEGVDLPHTDPLVIALQVGDQLVDRILVDPGSALNVMYKNMFEMLGLKPEDLGQTNTMMYGFDEAQVAPMGVVTLPIHVKPLTVDTEFQVIDVYSTSNAIVGRPWIHKTRAIPSTLHQLLKFHPDTGTEPIRGDQKASKECGKIELLRGNWQSDGFSSDGLLVGLHDVLNK
ncbi:unnamed protein product [Camellia sinensis]